MSEPFSPGPLNPRSSSIYAGRSSISVSRSQTDNQRKCGICNFNPKFLQIFTHRYWVLIILSLAFIFQQSISNGFPSTIYRTLEIRFNLNQCQKTTCDTLTEVVLEKKWYFSPKMVWRGACQEWTKRKKWTNLASLSTW